MPPLAIDTPIPRNSKLALSIELPLDQDSGRRSMCRLQLALLFDHQEMEKIQQSDSEAYARKLKEIDEKFKSSAEAVAAIIQGRPIPRHTGSNEHSETRLAPQED